MKGQKRKLPVEDGEYSDGSSPTWESQRQFIFTVSLHKYQRGQELREPSLRRSVLIANTLRYISLDISAPAEHTSEPVESSLGAHHQQQMTSFHSSSRSHVSASVEEDWEAMSTYPDYCCSTAVSSVLFCLDSSLDPLVAPRSALRSLENVGPAAGAGLRQSCRGQQGECRTPQNSQDASVEELFQEIDAALLEQELAVLGLRGEGEELLRYLPSALPHTVKCLPSFSAFCQSSAAHSPYPSPTPQRDGLELDHLMEILVES